jgi:hypothetical protein
MGTLEINSRNLGMCSSLSEQIQNPNQPGRVGGYRKIFPLGQVKVYFLPPGVKTNQMGNFLPRGRLKGKSLCGRHLNGIAQPERRETRNK